MMISEKMATRLNEQVKNEYFAFWSYQAMAYALDDMGFKGFSKWYEAQAREEMGHAMKIASYLKDQGAKVVLQALPEPKTEYNSVQEVVEAALQHELKVTKQVHEIAAMADGENDYATRKFIDWKVEEQVEEVSSMTDLLDMVKMCDTKGQLFMLEARLARSEH